MTGSNIGPVLTAYVDRIERLQDEADVIREDIKEVKKEAKGNGFDLKILNAVLARRRKRAKYTEQEWNERQELIDLYEGVLGMPGDQAKVEAEATLFDREQAA